MDQPEKDKPGSSGIQLVPFVVSVGFLAVVEARIYLLLRVWAGEITGAQIAHKDVPASGPSNPLIYVTLLVVLLIAIICFRRVQWLALALLLSIPIAFIFMIGV